MNVNQELFKKVKELNLPIGKYALFGSTPLGIRNLKNCHDIDIVVAEELWDEYKNKAEWELKEMPNKFKDVYLCNGDIELWKNWRPENWDIRDLIRNAEIIEGLPFVKLEEVIKWKKMNGREKDLMDVEVAENYIRNNK